jgi:glycosyltransferase involved in cell wall biosynthesis
VVDQGPGPWLTVVTVVKDAPTDVARTIASVASQDLTGVEYVVVDGSDDRSTVPGALEGIPSLAAEYAWSAPRGIYPAMNEGLALARGDYVYFANAGDVFFDAEVLSRVRAATQDTEAPWLFGDVEILSPSGHRVITPRWDYANEQAACFSRGHFPCHQGTFALRALLLDQGGFDTSYSIVADYAAFLKLTLVGDPTHLDFVIATFAEGGVSTTRWRESFRQFHRARREILRPRGRAALREYRETVKRYAAVEFYRSAWSKVARR